jgi:RNA polymerase sigma-70 factor, ECF subfamily
MDDPTGSDLRGPFQARYLAFLETTAHLRPRLHRYCSRMTGSVMDGEDIVQEALFRAYRKLDSFDDNRALTPWLFQIAHNRCIDFLRRRQVRRDAETASMQPEFFMPADPIGKGLNHAVEHLVMVLAPKERACVLLKDVFDYSLEEIAELVGSTVGGVKSALKHGRSKLASLPPRSVVSATEKPKVSHLLHLYVERFNRRDWDGVRELIAADARLLVADRFEGPLADAPYFGRYASLAVPWQIAVGEVDGQQSALSLRQQNGFWIPYGIIRIAVVNNSIARVVDYSHCPWVLAATHSAVSADLLAEPAYLTSTGNRNAV